MWEATLRKTQAAKKQANSLSVVVSITPNGNGDKESDRASDSGEPFYAKKILPEGDYYKGKWYDNFPNGQDKYL